MLAKNEAYEISPFFHDAVNGLTYSYGADGLNTGTRSVLRAKSVLAVAFMRGVATYRVEGNLLVCGEPLAVSTARLPDQLLSHQRIDTGSDAKHVGFFILPDANSGWGRHAGWAAFYLEGTPEHSMFNVYRMFAHTMRYLLKNKDVYENIVSTRY